MGDLCRVLRMSFALRARRNTRYYRSLERGGARRPTCLKSGHRFAICWIAHPREVAATRKRDEI